MKKFALALVLALYGGGDAFAMARPLAAHGLPNNHISVRGARGDGTQSKRRAEARRGKRRRSAAKGKSGGANEVDPLLVSVIEIDAEGLKNLLRRGEGVRANPLLINFWATWCVPCRKEFPDLVKIEADYRGRGLEFVTISADDVTDIKTGVPKFLLEMRATEMPAYLLNAADTEAAIAQVDPAWGGELPATFLFNREGKLVYKHFGIIDAAKLRASIDQVMPVE